MATAPATKDIGRKVFVSYIMAAGVIIGVEYPYPDEPDTPLYEVELEWGQICHATAGQAVFRGN